jgi:hypothetical protein
LHVTNARTSRSAGRPRRRMVRCRRWPRVSHKTAPRVTDVGRRLLRRSRLHIELLEGARVHDSAASK